MLFVSGKLYKLKRSWVFYTCQKIGLYFEVKVYHIPIEGLFLYIESRYIGSGKKQFFLAPDGILVWDYERNFLGHDIETECWEAI